MKRTTIYIDENDIDRLKKAAFLYDCTVSEVIRMGIRQVCSPEGKEVGKFFSDLEAIRSQFKEFSEEEIETLVDTERKIVRSENKGRN